MYKETLTRKAGRMNAAADVLFDRAKIEPARAAQFRRIAWKLVRRAQGVKPWPMSGLARQPAPLTTKAPRIPKAERDAMKIMRDARRALPNNTPLSVTAGSAWDHYFQAIENYYAVCGGEYARPRWATRKRKGRAR